MQGSVVVQKTLEMKDTNTGFNAQSLKYEDMFGAGVIDPAKVVRFSLQNAVSVGALLLTTEAAVAEEENDKDEGMGGMEEMGDMM